MKVESVFLSLLAMLAGACSSSAPADSPVRDSVAAVSAEAESTPSGTAAQAETLLVDVQSLAPEIRVEMRYATANNFTGAPLPGYEANRALLRREAAAALARVQGRLEAQGLGLKVFDAYRPVRATLAMMDWTERVGRQDLVRDGYIARRSRHNLGVAIDLTLIDPATGREMEMGTPYDEFTEAAHTANASGDVAERRRTLVAAMEAEGFTNYEREWWHFSHEVSNPLRFDVTVR
jgi:D-alanyl-D-alanine dipeptidase